MKDNKWFWIAVGCLVSWTIIFLWVDWVITSHAETGEYVIELEESW